MKSSTPKNKIMPPVYGLYLTKQRDLASKVPINRHLVLSSDCGSLYTIPLGNIMKEEKKAHYPNTIPSTNLNDVEPT